MFSKFLSVAGKIFTIFPTVFADVEGSIKKIEADTNLYQRVVDGLDSALVLLDDVGKALGL